MNLLALLSWAKRLIRPIAPTGRSSGPPRSANGASSFHITWATHSEFLAVAATLEVLDAPAVDSLYFWALQADFTSGGGRRGGAGHLGLQWHRAHPGHGAVNWGGYDQGGQILRGTESVLPSGQGNDHTRDYLWQPGREYRLRIEQAPDLTSEPPFHPWRGTVTDLTTGETTVIRELFAFGDRLTRPIVWSEVFADCDAPSVGVRWSALEGELADGTIEQIGTVRTNYQTEADGGCSNTDTSVEGGGFVQRTSVPRTNTSRTGLSL